MQESCALGKRRQESVWEWEIKLTHAFQERLVAIFRVIKYSRTYFLLLLGLFVVPVASLLVRHLLFIIFNPSANLWFQSFVWTFRTSDRSFTEERLEDEEEKIVAPPALGRKTFCGAIKMAVNLCQGLWVITACACAFKNWAEVVHVRICWSKRGEQNRLGVKWMFC